MKSTALSLGLSIAFVVSSDAGARAQSALLDPTQYASPSGEHVLFVDPTDRYGRGPARYRLTSNEREVWTCEFPFALRDVRVSDVGEAAGYSVQLEDFTVAWIAPNGELRHSLTTAAWTRKPCGSPWPRPHGIEFDSAGQRLWVQVQLASGRFDAWLFDSVSGLLPEIPAGVESPLTEPERRRKTPTPEAPPIPTIELTPFGVTQLDAPLMFSAKGAGRILADGRICLQDRETGGLFVWDETGARTLTGTSVPFETSSRSTSRITTGPDGSIWAERRGGRYVGWSAEGHSLGEVDVDPELHGPFDFMWFEPSDPMRWITRHSRTLLRLDPQGTEVERIERRPEGRWLRGVNDLLFLEDALAILEGGSRKEGVPAQIVTRPHTGPPTAIELPLGAPCTQLHVTPSWWLTASVLPQAFLVRREPVASTPSLRRTAVEPTRPQAFLIDLKNLRDKNTWAFGFSEDGERLLALERESLRLYHFLVP